MMFHRLKLINKNQLGFTLIELVMAITISTVITGAITSTLYQVIIGSARTNNHMTVVRQAQDAGFWVSHDVQMAQTMVLASDPDGFPLNLKWTEWNGKVNEVTYNIVNNELRRSQSINGGGTTNTPVAKFIDSDIDIDSGLPKTRCELGGAFTLPDVGDAFTITGGLLADSGKITVDSGSISVTASGGATYNVRWHLDNNRRSWHYCRYRPRS